MQRVGHPVTSGTPLQIPPQPEPARSRNQHPILLDTIHPLLLPQAIINPEKGVEGGPLPLSPPRPCGSQGPGLACWSMDVRVTVVLVVTVAGALILLLLYRLLKLRHKLKLAKARHALEYCSFFHTATYTLKDPGLSQILPAGNGNVVSEVAPAVQTEAPVKKPPAVSMLPAPPVSPLPPLPAPPPTTPVLPPPPPHPPPALLIPPPPLRRPTLPLLQTLSLPLPVIHTTPPSPHLSWGASSDVEVYSRIGAYRPSRHSSLSTRSQVILFEHSSL